MMKLGIGNEIFAKHKEGFIYSSRVCALVEADSSNGIKIYAAIPSSFSRLSVDKKFYLGLECSEDVLCSVGSERALGLSHTSPTTFDFIPIKNETHFDESQDLEEPFSKAAVGETAFLPQMGFGYEDDIFYVSGIETAVTLEGYSREGLLPISVFGRSQKAISVNSSFLGARCYNSEGLIGVVVAYDLSSMTLFLDTMESLSESIAKEDSIRFASSNGLLAWNNRQSFNEESDIASAEALAGFFLSNDDYNWTIEEVQDKFIRTLEAQENEQQFRNRFLNFLTNEKVYFLLGEGKIVSSSDQPYGALNLAVILDEKLRVA